MSLRLALRVGSVALMVGSLIPAMAPKSWTVEVPRTLHAALQLDHPNGQMRALGFRATDLGVSWRGTEDGAPAIRTSRDGIAWSGWRKVDVSDDLSDPAGGLWFSSLLDGRGASFVEMQRGVGDAESVTLHALNTKDGPRRVVRVKAGAWAATPQPHVISRAEWGADESLRSGCPGFARVRKLVVHHTVTANDDPDPMARIRAIYAYHTQSRGFCDIAYNFLIDSNGNVYEGRHARDYAPGETPDGEDEDGRGVIGAHALNYNTGSAGVALLGDFSSVAPRDAAVASLVELLAWKADRHGIDPRGTDVQGLPNIAGHRDLGSTACPGDLLYPQLPNIRRQVESRIEAMSGLSAPAMPTATELLPRVISRDRTPAAAGAVSRSTTRVDMSFDGTGLLSHRRFLLSPHDGSFELTDADYLGIALPEDRYAVAAVAYDAEDRASPIAKVASDYVITLGDTPAAGYWILGSDGGVFSYGSATFFGSMGGRPLSKPVVGMAATTSGGGYWLVASDGGIFAFGDAHFNGSTGAMKLSQPIVGMAPTPTGGGYWLVASDGGIFAFGDAHFYGSTGAMKLNQPIVGMAPTPTGGGYWLVASDGGIFAFGDAHFFGSVPSRGIRANAVRMAPTFTGAGYYVLGRDGSIYVFGDAPWYGSMRSSGIRSSARDLALVG